MLPLFLQCYALTTPSRTGINCQPETKTQHRFPATVPSSYAQTNSRHCGFGFERIFRLDDGPSKSYDLPEPPENNPEIIEVPDRVEVLSRFKDADLTESGREQLKGNIEEIAHRSLDEAVKLYMAYVFSGEPRLANGVLGHLWNSRHRNAIDFNHIARQLLTRKEKLSPYLVAVLAPFQIVTDTENFPRWILELPEDQRRFVLARVLEAVDTVELNDPNYAEVIDSFTDPALRRQMMTEYLMTSYEASPTSTLTDTLSKFSHDAHFPEYVEAIVSRWHKDDPVGIQQILEELRSNPATRQEIDNLRLSDKCPTLLLCVPELQTQ